MIRTAFFLYPHVMSSTLLDDSALEKSSSVLKERRFKLSRYFLSRSA
jgi:hypothetical protein